MVIQSDIYIFNHVVYLRYIRVRIHVYAVFIRSTTNFPCILPTLRKGQIKLWSFGQGSSFCSHTAVGPWFKVSSNCGAERGAVPSCGMRLCHRTLTGQDGHCGHSFQAFQIKCNTTVQSVTALWLQAQASHGPVTEDVKVSSFPNHNGNHNGSCTQDE